MANSIVAQCQNILFKKLSNAPLFEKFETQKKELFNIIENVIVNGARDSVLIEDLTYSETVPVLNVFEEIFIKFEGNYSLLKLDGIIHQNENVAFKIITQHLGLNSTNLEVSGSFHDRVNFVMESLETTNHKAKPIIFLFNNFEKFCTNSQTLVYNLLDASYSTKASVCVILVTKDTKLVQTFGKRELSRFSNRSIVLQCVNDIEKYTFMFKSILLIEEPVLEKSFRNKWNENIKELCSNNYFMDLLEKVHLENLNEEKFRNILAIIICNIDEEPPHLTYNIIENAVKGYLPRDTFSNLEMPEICVLVAIYHHVYNYKNEKDAWFNFAIIYDRLKKRKYKLKCCCLEKLRVQKAFERIAGLFLNVKKEESPEFTMFGIRKPIEGLKIFINNDIEIPDEIRNWMNDQYC